eukprot:m.261587 g.261587  ORF g.261587 m.261587 type:complete len:350 (-) comp24742_c0_seq1:305-1354(-)
MTSEFEWLDAGHCTLSVRVSVWTRERGYDAGRLREGVARYINEIRPLLHAEAAAIPAADRIRMEEIRVRIAWPIDASSLPAALKIPPVGSEYEPVYDMIDGALYVVAVRLWGIHGDGHRRMSGQVDLWATQARDMGAGIATAHPSMTPTGLHAPQPDVSIYPSGNVEAAPDYEPALAANQPRRAMRFAFEVEVTNRSPKRILTDFLRYFTRPGGSYLRALFVLKYYPETQAAVALLWMRPDDGPRPVVHDPVLVHAWDCGYAPATPNTRLAFETAHANGLPPVPPGAWITAIAPPVLARAASAPFPSWLPLVVMPGHVLSYRATVRSPTPDLLLDLPAMIAAAAMREWP